MQPAMPAALMLLLSLGISTLAAYVALDLARRVRVLRTRAGALWLLGAASALATGVWSCQIIGVAAEPVAFRLGYEVTVSSKSDLPGYQGSVDLQYATVSR